MLARIRSTNFTKTATRATLLASTAAVVVAFAGSAKADDAMVTKAPVIPFINGLSGPAYNWNGFYAGGHFGYAWGNSNWTAGSPGAPDVSGSFSVSQPIDSFSESGPRSMENGSFANQRQCFVCLGTMLSSRPFLPGLGYFRQWAVMIERSRAVRTKVFLAAQIRTARRPPLVIDCVVRDVSPLGARLELRDTSTLPNIFELTFDAGRTLRACHVVWRTPTDVGVEFSDGVIHGQSETADPLARRKPLRFSLQATQRLIGFNQLPKIVRWITRDFFAAVHFARSWHKASIRGTAAFRSVSDRSGHEPAGKTGCIGRE